MEKNAKRMKQVSVFMLKLTTKPPNMTGLYVRKCVFILEVLVLHQGLPCQSAALPLSCNSNLACYLSHDPFLSVDENVDLVFYASGNLSVD